MNKLIHGLITLAALAGLALVPNATALAAAGSGGASLSLSPASGSYTVGSQITVAVHENSSVPVAGIEADFTYDASALQCAGIDASGSGFGQAYPSNCSGGSVTIARTTVSGTVTGSQSVASVTFTVLKGSGTTRVASAGSSEIDDATTANVCDTSCNTGGTAANFSLTTPVAPTPGGKGSGGGSTGVTSPAGTTNSTAGSNASSSTSGSSTSKTTGSPSSSGRTSDSSKKTIVAKGGSNNPQIPKANGLKNNHKFNWTAWMGFLGSLFVVIDVVIYRQQILATTKRTIRASRIYLAHLLLPKESGV